MALFEPPGGLPLPFPGAPGTSRGELCLHMPTPTLWVEDAESSAHQLLEKGLRLTERAYRKMILPATRVNFQTFRPCSRFLAFAESSSSTLDLVSRSTEKSRLLHREASFRRAAEALQAEKTQLEAQLAATRLVAAAAEASRAEEKAALEARLAKAEKAATESQSAAEVATLEKATLEVRLAEAEKAAAESQSAVEVAAQTAAREKAALEAKVADLQGSLGQAESDLEVAREQVVVLDAQVTRAVTEGTRLRELAEKREQEILGEWFKFHDFTLLPSCLACNPL